MRGCESARSTIRISSILPAKSFFQHSFLDERSELSHWRRQPTIRLNQISRAARLNADSARRHGAKLFRAIADSSNAGVLDTRVHERFARFSGEATSDDSESTISLRHWVSFSYLALLSAGCSFSPRFALQRRSQSPGHPQLWILYWRLASVSRILPPAYPPCSVCRERQRDRQ